MSDSVLSRLSEFQPTDPTPRLVDAVLKVVPGVEPLPPYAGLPGVVAALGGGPAQVAAATARLGDEGVGNVLWMSGLVDTGDRGYAVVTGVASAIRFFFGDKDKRSQALETDAQQRNDAVLKAFALAYMAHQAFDGGIAERARAFAAAPAGQALLTYYAAIELALPFADNAMLGTGELFGRMLASDGQGQLRRLGGMAGGRDMGGVQEALGALQGAIEGSLERVRPHVDAIASAARTHVPKALDTGDKVAGALANVADLMPVYRYLGGRLAAESAVIRAQAG